MKRRAVFGVLIGSGALLFCLALRPDDPMWNGRRMSAWVRDLESPDRNAQIAATSTLQKAGPAAAASLGKALRQNAFPAVFSSILQRTPFARAVSPSQTDGRRLALQLLTLLGPAAAPALPDIIPLLADPSRFNAQDTEHLLRLIGPAAGQALAQHVRTGPEHLRAGAARALRDFGSNDQSIDALISALRDKSPLVRANAAESLGVFRAKAALRPLLQATSDASSTVRAQSCEALGHLGEKSAVAQLRACLGDTSPAVQLEAAKAFWKIQRDPAPVLPVLRQLLITGETWRATFALSELRGDAAPAVPDLIRQMSREAVPRPFRSSSSATYALGQIGAPAIPALQEALRNADPMIRLNAAIALGFMQAAAAPATEDLLNATHDRKLEVRQAAALSLGAIGATNQTAIASLAECLHAEDIVLRSTALNHLRRLAPDAEWSAGSE